MGFPANEDERLAALRRYKVLDTPPEPGFERITALAVRLFAVPVCVISLVDECRVWFKSKVGWSGEQVQRDESLCSWAILQKELMVIHDARFDGRLACNPWVQAEPGIRFYAGAPLTSPDGFNLGTLCLIDTQPHATFDEPQRRTLADLAAIVVDELELRLSLESAEQSRLAAEAANRAKDEFLALLSHELRTPLNPIIGWTQMLKRGSVAADKQVEVLEIIERNAKLQNQLIQDLLDVARIEQGKFSHRPQPVILSGVVQAAVEAVRTLAKDAGVALEVEVAERLPEVMVDPTRMQQVVWNLLTNAIKFTPSGGWVQLHLVEAADCLCLVVSDSGTGISPAFIPHLFERFRQAGDAGTRRQGGLGLGLFIVRYIVELHGGRVWAKSDGQGKGAVFTVELPLCECRANASDSVLAAEP
ncbi:GAF domain-containing sensor histidine kinase [Gloeobacter violaceus]|uniref:GAF domain-containing sensor histidine kinase n=1 Tax=Gloeobacter violaceus TaxID=33072 RepID=UPI0003038F51|nr:GAF domain-containing sensor histidine kinase [Gloeobacter violaceus]